MCSVHDLRTIDGTRIGFFRPEVNPILREFLRFQYRNNQNVKPKDVQTAWRTVRIAEGAMVSDPETGEPSAQVCVSLMPQ